MHRVLGREGTNFVHVETAVIDAAPSDDASRVLQFILDNSLLLLIGAVTALVWANVDLDSYDRVRARAALRRERHRHGVLLRARRRRKSTKRCCPAGRCRRRAQARGAGARGGRRHGRAGARSISLSSSGSGDAATTCAAGRFRARPTSRSRTWSRASIFPAGHPAIPFLLLLAIADDALGLIVLAIFYPSGAVSLAAARRRCSLPGDGARVGAAAYRASRVSGCTSVGPGLLSWLGLYYGGLHPALALVPIVPFMPHDKSDLARVRTDANWCD